MATPARALKVVKANVEFGHTSIDTAQSYMSNHNVGKALEYVWDNMGLLDRHVLSAQIMWRYAVIDPSWKKTNPTCARFSSSSPISYYLFGLVAHTRAASRWLR